MKSTDTPTNIAVEINRLHDGIVGALRNTVADAIEIGRLLTEHRDSLGHGEWMPWLKANVRFDDRTARRYASLYENRDKLDSVSNLNDAYKLLKQPRTPKVTPITPNDRLCSPSAKDVFNQWLEGVPANDRKYFVRDLINAATDWQDSQSADESDPIEIEAEVITDPATLTLPAPALPKRAVKPATNAHRHRQAFSSLSVKGGEVGARQVRATQWLAAYKRYGDTEWTNVGECHSINKAHIMAEQALLAGGKN
jgi:hypothetical protein